MDINCSRGVCDPCRESISIKHNGMEHFCFRHFVPFYRDKNGYSPIFYDSKLFGGMTNFITYFFEKHKVCVDIQKRLEEADIVDRELETSDIVGECFREVE